MDNNRQVFSLRKVLKYFKNSLKIKKKVMLSQNYKVYDNNNLTIYT